MLEDLENYTPDEAKRELSEAVVLWVYNTARGPLTTKEATKRANAMSQADRMQAWRIYRRMKALDQGEGSR